MKKLLALIGSVSLVASTVTSVGFEYASWVKSSIEAKIRNYINISSLLARGTILSQKSTDIFDQATDGRDFSLNYASQYLYEQKMKTFFGSDQFPIGEQSVRNYFGAMFNLTSGQNDIYTVRNDPDFVSNSPTLSLQDDINAGKSGQDPAMTILGYLGAFGPLLFGQDFGPDSIANLLENVLKAGEGPILDLFNNGTFKTIQELLFLGNNSLFARLADSLSEKDLENQFPGDLTNLTFGEVFNFRQISFWQGIAEICFSGAHAEDTPAEIATWMQSIADAEDGNYAKKAIPADNETSPFNIALNQVLLDGVTRIIPYLRTLMVYIQSFSENYLRVDQIDDGNHLFHQSQLNGVFIADKIKNGKYINPNNVVDDTNTPEVIQWVTKDGHYQQVVNFQDLIQFFAHLLSVDLRNDAAGYRAERILSILLEMPLKDAQTKDDEAVNPVFDLILAPFLTQFLLKLETEPSGIGPIIAILLPSYTPFFRAVLAHNQSFWESKPVVGADQNFDNGVKVLTKLGETLHIFLPEIGTVLNQLVANIRVEENTPPPVKDRVYDRPYTSLYSGDLLTIIFDLLKANGIEIPEKIFQTCQNFATLLTTNLGEILESFNLQIDVLPIFLYGIKDLSLNEIINSFADEFQTNLTKTLKENQSFLFNLEALKRVMSALDVNVKITFKEETPPPIIEAGIEDLNQVNILSAVLIAFAYSSEIEELYVDYLGTGNPETWSTSNLNSYTWLLGNRKDENGIFSFAAGSVFGSLSQIYGHNNDDDPRLIQIKTAETLRHLAIEISKLVAWFSGVSIPSYIENTFDPYFASKNWSTELIRAENVTEAFKIATIEYNLYYKNPDLVDSEVHRYQVVLSRPGFDGDFEDWNEMGQWKIASINLKR